MQFMDMFSSQKRIEKRAAKKIYDNLLNQALNPQLYQAELAQDTFQGRFEQVALHGALVMRVLRDRGQTALASAVSEAIFAGLDHAYRETGVGDSSISRKVRKLGEQFYGLAQGLDQGLESNEDAALSDFIARNGLAIDQEDRLLGYLRRADKGLSQVKELSDVVWPEV